MQRIDAHQHFWVFNAERDSWITDEMSVIRKDFLPQQLKLVLEENSFDGCVTVQSDQSENENIFQLINAEENVFVKGVNTVLGSKLFKKWFTEKEMRRWLVTAYKKPIDINY